MGRLGGNAGLYLFLIVIHGLWLAPLGIALWNRWVVSTISAQLPQDIASAPLGQRVLLEGWAMPDRISPRPSTLGQVTCLWHDWRVEREMQPFDQDRASDPFDGHNQGATEEPFALENAAGERVLIDPAHAVFEAVPSRSWTGASSRPGGVFPGLGLFRYTERWILPRQPLFVIGRLDPPEPGDPGNIRGRIARGGRGPLVVAGESPEMVFATARRRANLALVLAGVLLPLALVATAWLVS